jgi:CRP-like cAMP-binding protein
LLSHASSGSLGLREVVHEQDEPASAVHFPTVGVVSLVTMTEDGSSVELALIGNEGVVGVGVFLGSRRLSNQRAVVQVPGESLRVDADIFQAELAQDGKVSALLQNYTVALLTQIGQGVACNRLHSLEERCARWLLMTGDRVGRDEFPITQEFLAQMLGVRRPSVTLAAGVLQRAGFISYRRGEMQLLDRDGLEQSSCECYGVVRDAYERLLPQG